MTLKLPDLPYSYDALAPYMSVETLQFHHDKHHLAYVDNGNKLLAGSKYEGKSLEDICAAAFADKNAGLVNNVGQHFNHLHFWQWMKKGGGGKTLPGKLEKLVEVYGGFDKLRADFINAGLTQFGSGWAWLAIKDGKLEVLLPSNEKKTVQIGDIAKRDGPVSAMPPTGAVLPPTDLRDLIEFLSQRKAKDGAKKPSATDHGGK